MSLGIGSWHATWQALGAPRGNEALFDRLVAAYSEPPRHYHTLQHLRECFEVFDTVRAEALRPEEVELATWFHDAVYDVHRDDNEERSAAWAVQSLPPPLAAGHGAGVAVRIRDMILATRDHVAHTTDGKLLADIDLAILGAAPKRFDEYGRQVRAEYAHVPEAEFRQRRREVLQGFLARTRIYATASLHDRLEARARENLARAVRELA